LLIDSRGKSRRQIEELLARLHPRPDVPERIEELPRQLPGLTADPVTCPGPGKVVPRDARVEPLSATSYRVEFTASAELRDKIERAGQLLSHVIPAGNLPMLLERALDVLIEAETKRRLGADKPRKRRKLAPGSRHVPVDVARVVWQRDGAQCAFVDAEGRRCSERRHLTIEHIQPFAKGGLAIPDALCLLCSAHNQHSARRVFGEEHIAKKKREALESRVCRALVQSGFRERDARRAIQEIAVTSVDQDFATTLRAALRVLVPPCVQVRDSAALTWRTGFRQVGIHRPVLRSLRQNDHETRV
jgi:hypothetical protein